MRAYKLILFVVIATASSPPEGSAYEFSSYNFSKNAARPPNSLEVEMRGRSALVDYAKLTRVGGVNFQGEASVAEFQELIYRSDAPDGQRARINLSQNEYVIPLFDWQLKPIVRYADSTFTAVVSIFGDGPDLENFRYIDFHPAFEDTHLGMRLLQADLMLLDPVVFSEAPTKFGEPVYFPGEARALGFSDRLNQTMPIVSLMSSVQEHWQSYVFTDVGQSYSFQPKGTGLEFTIKPYYYFWGSNNDEIIERIFSSYEQAVFEYNQAVDTYLDSPAGSPEEESALRMLDSLRAHLDDLEADLLDPSGVEVVEAEHIGAEVRSSQEILHKTAPFVYDAAAKTAEYSALFRGIKRLNPEAWLKFARIVEDSVDLIPSQTPNQFDR